MKMKPSLSIPLLNEYFSQSNRRKILLAQLDAEVNNWSSQFSMFRVYIFGSFITPKPNPGDIDLLLTGVLVGGNIYQKKSSSSNIQIISSLSSPNFPPTAPQPTLASAKKLIDKFNQNPANIASKITISTTDIARLII